MPLTHPSLDPFSPYPGIPYPWGLHFVEAQFLWSGDSQFIQSWSKFLDDIGVDFHMRSCFVLMAKKIQLAPKSCLYQQNEAENAFSHMQRLAAETTSHLLLS